MYIDFIPKIIYTPIYYYVLAIFVLLAFFHTHNKQLGSAANYAFYRVAGGLLLVFVIIYMGLRPVSGVFVDMKTYYYMYKSILAGREPKGNVDPFFLTFMRICSKFMDAHGFFFVCTLIYIVPIYSACRKWFAKHWFYPFLAIVVSFTFWAYGTNGIRNGMATSLFIYAISRDNVFNRAFWIIVSIALHKSMLIPTAAYIATFVNNNSKLYLWFWVISIPLSLAMGGFWQSLFAELMPVDDRASTYLTGEVYAEQFSKTGFRWDFVLYSFVGVFAAWYYIFRMKLKDEFYVRLCNTYLLANGFWILVIRANFSNRFAYLSWFLLALVIFYPLLRQLLIKEQHKKIGIYLFLYFGFTFVMNVILKK